MDQADATYPTTSAPLDAAELDALYPEAPIGALDAEDTMKRLRRRVLDLNQIKGELGFVETVDNVARAGAFAAGFFVALYPAGKLFTGAMAFGAGQGVALAGLVNEWQMQTSETQLKQAIDTTVRAIVSDTQQLVVEIRETIKDDATERKALSEVEMIIDEAFGKGAQSQKDLDAHLAKIQKLLDEEERRKKEGKTLSQQEANDKLATQNRITALRAELVTITQTSNDASRRRELHAQSLQRLAVQRDRLIRTQVVVPSSLDQQLARSDRALHEISAREAQIWNEYLALHRALFPNEPPRVDRYLVPPPTDPRRDAYLRQTGERNAVRLGQVVTGTG